MGSDKGTQQQVLDTCIDRLIQGEDWRAVVDRRPGEAEITGLMVVAERILDLARRSPSPGPGVRARVLSGIRDAGLRLAALFHPLSPDRWGAIT
jgi:hypothetical protein